MFYLFQTSIRMMHQKPRLRLVQGDCAGGAEEPSDDELMLLAAKHHQQAFEILVRRYHHLVLGLATRYLGDPSLGRDIAQDVFLALWAERQRYRGQNRFRSYLVACTLHRCRIVARQARSQERKRDHWAEELEVDAPVANEALRALIEAEQRREVREMLTHLPHKMKEVLILRFTHGLAVQEISVLTGLREGTVKSHLSRGVARLHRLLAKDDP